MGQPFRLPPGFARRGGEGAQAASDENPMEPDASGGDGSLNCSRTLAAQGHGATGAISPRGGIVATANGLLFIATASDRKFRAYDQDSGQVLWEKELSAGAEGVPAAYEIAGREYIALCAAAGDGDLHIDTDKPAVPPGPGSYMVFALPPK